MGVANTVYHPADYSILSAAIDGKKIGKAFSIHTFAGYLGFGVTPAMVLACAAIWDWRGAFLFAAGLSFAAALLLIVAGSVLPRVVRKPMGPSKAEAKVGLGLLLSPPILRNLLFFFCLAMANGGIQTFTVVGMGALHGTPASVANIALSGFLLCSAGGVLLGGIIADRTPHHERVAAVGFACTAAMAILMALGEHAGRGPDRRHVAGRPVERHHPAVARHDGARRHAAAARSARCSASSPPASTWAAWSRRCSSPG